LKENPMPTFDTIAFDADDTLWRGGQLFKHVKVN